MSTATSKTKAPRTPYETMKAKVGTGRRKLAPEERARRQALRSQKLRRHMEAKRRGWFVLEHKYADEFNAIYNKEFKALGKEEKFKVTV